MAGFDPVSHSLGQAQGMLAAAGERRRGEEKMAARDRTDYVRAKARYAGQQERERRIARGEKVPELRRPKMARRSED